MISETIHNDMYNVVVRWLCASARDARGVRAHRHVRVAAVSPYDSIRYISCTRPPSCITPCPHLFHQAGQQRRCCFDASFVDPLSRPSSPPPSTQQSPQPSRGLTIYKIPYSAYPLLPTLPPLPSLQTRTLPNLHYYSSNYFHSSRCVPSSTKQT